MKFGRIVIESGGIVTPLGKRETGRKIDMFLPTSAKSLRTRRVAGLRICYLVFSTRLRNLTKF
ncbi:hypothetical protein MTR67_052914 [Solanum verrucosum]|uniref:Uncharacterized protein n=1 Tax=Solanum verrucosum TaxID=315347 RepID=A0AAF0V8S0_SOLVR|nr:hypothetical protein MTR67_052914 [Solanum verrucosum]